MVDGAVAEEGTHEELLRRNGEYSRLYSIQALEEGETEKPELLH
jgi:ABC-type multidrug transport system fused ATPase/permease subunit